MNKSLEIIETSFGNFIIDEYDLIGNSIKNYKVWEYHLYEIYSKIITKEYYCIDAGANIGFHSVQFGKLGKKVYSFEPQSYVYNQLCTNILFNDLNNIVITYRLGLGNTIEKKQLWNIEHESWVGNGMHNWGGRGIIPNPNDYNTDRTTSNKFREEDTIQVVTLDSQDINKCDLIKIDVQGYEYYLIEGAYNLLKKNKPVIFLENPILGEDDLKNSLKVKQQLTDIGYEFFRLNIGNKEDCVLIHPSSVQYNKNSEIINQISSKYNIIKE
jgi:FkbM family methyltransferase